MKRRFSILLVSMLAACGTAYQMPDVSDRDKAAAAQALAEEKALSAKPAAPVDVDRAIRNFVAVKARVEPAAEKFCRTHVEAQRTCDIQISVLDDFSAAPNAFQHYRGSRPEITFTPSMILEARNQDELAFILGHEMGHHMAAHIEKKQKQQMAGMLITGMIGAYAGAYDTYTPQYQKQQNLENMMNAGAAIGGQAYSQTYELEADMIGANIAELAGYDAARGARIFAREKSARTVDGTLSFWGTHPRSSQRVALVSAVRRQIETNGVGLTGK